MDFLKVVLECSRVWHDLCSIVAQLPLKLVYYSTTTKGGGGGGVAKTHSLTRMAPVLLLLLVWSKQLVKSRPILI